MGPKTAPRTVTLNVHEAKTHLSRLLDRALEGEEIVIARAGKPLVRLVPVEQAPRRRRIGSAAGQFQVPDDFLAPLDEEILREFER